MEIKNTRPQKSDGKMVIDESSNTESCNSYCPDFSDICDDSYGFWDFLPNQKGKNEALGCEGELRQKTNFWDFLGPSSKKGQHGLIKSSDSAVTSPNEEGTSFENAPQPYSKNKSLGTTVSNGSNFMSPELKSTSSDEEFWDFLSSKSPVVTFKELIKNYESTNNDTESGINSFASRVDESPFPSISEYMESEGYSTLHSSPSSVSVKAIQFLGNENETQNFNSRQSSKVKYRERLKETAESVDYTSYVDVLNYLQQECIVSDSEVNLSADPNNAFFHESSSKINKENGKYQRSLDSLYSERDKFNGKSGQIQQQNQESSSISQQSALLSNQRPIYDGTEQVFSLKSDSGELTIDGNSNIMNSFKQNNQQRGRIHVINKRPAKRFKRNIPRIAVTSYSKVESSKPTLTQRRLNTVNIVNINQPNIQTPLQSFKSANSYNTEYGVRSNSTSVVNTLGSNISTATYCTTAMTTTVNTAGSNTSTNSTPLYLLMPTNSETLQNPNYSHYFLVINNSNNSNAQVNQPTIIQNSAIGTNANNLKDIPIHLNKSKVNSEIGIKPDNLKQNVLIVNQPITADSSSAFVAKPSVSNIKYQSIPQVYLPYTSLMNSAAGTNQLKVQYVSKIPTVNNVASSTGIPSTISNVFLSSPPIMNIYPTNKSSGVTEQTTNFKPDLKLKAMQSKSKQPALKPIKNISLGKDKYAIQQISTPVPICGGEELNNSQGYSNFNNLNESFLLENKLTSRIHTNSSETVVNNVSNIRGTLSTVSNNFLQKNNCQNINLKPTSVATNLLPSVCTIDKNVNLQENSQISAANPINVNVVPVSGPLGINKNVPVVNTIQVIKNSKQSISSLNLNTTSNLVSLKAGNSQNKSLATLQELFPPPISMFPVCVLPQAKAQETSQPNTSRVLILKNNAKEQTVTPKLRIDPIPNRQRLISKKAKEKLKKGRLKTVRELLQERRKSGSNHSRNNKKVGKEIRVLRPILRLSSCDVCPSKSSPIITNISKLDTAANRNHTEETCTRKRPNILLLPSSSKIIKNTNFTEDKQDNLGKEQESKSFAESSVTENVEDSLSYTNSAVDKKDSRPRHYDMSQLIIGDFRVDDDIDSCGRFRSKFKVIFTKRVFYCDFPVSRCNQYSLKSTDVWEHMVRITVPFKTVVSMGLNERMIEISLNTQPEIALGRLQARTGIIPNSTMYDIAVESDSTWGSMIRNSFHHKIILRKKQADKLKSFLCQFDDRFLNIINAGLCESGMNGVDELSVFDGELSPTTLKQNVTKNKKHYIRRLSQWDSSENEDQKSVEEDLVLLNQMCSCRVSCRSIRCSCVKAAKSCNSVCDCINCDNPLNILERLGMNLDFSLSDSCLFQNIYQIPKLVPFLKKEVKLTCCNTFARVQDCIPGTVLCPNVDCNVQLEFSWCKKVVCYPERNPRNHCSFCGQCCFSNGRHCLTCNRCYVATPKLPNCPTCQEKTTVANLKDMESNYYNCDSKDQDNRQKSASKLVQKPEIVILDVYSIAKDSSKTENSGESLNNESSTNYDSMPLRGLANFQDSTECVINIE